MRDRTVAEAFGEFAASVSYDSLPASVRTQAVTLILDAVGTALASSRQPFATAAGAAVDVLADGGVGSASVVGSAKGRQARDAALLNGLLIHGLDYDDTHPAAVLHPTASVLPTALALAESGGAGGRSLMESYVVGLEVACRVGALAGGGFHQAGFHPTGLVGAFGSAVAAARMLGLPANAIAQAQGVVHSMASGSLAFLDNGAWTKRIHPGWAASSGIAAAAFAQAGHLAPTHPYEGRFGLYATHLGEQPSSFSSLTERLGEEWALLDVAIKPYPACHFTHAFAEAAISLHERAMAAPIESVECLIAAEAMPVVCEPWAGKQRPTSAYEAQFSLAYVTAAALRRGRFTLLELEEDAWTDSGILALTDRTCYRPDSGSAFPDAYSGEVRVTMEDGRVLRRRVQVNRGAGDRPLTRADVVAKFDENASLVLAEPRLSHVRAALLDLPSQTDVRRVMAMLRARDDSATGGDR